MEQSEDTFIIEPRNELILHHILPDDIFSRVKKDVEENLGESYNKRLVGSMKEQYGFQPSQPVLDHILNTSMRFLQTDRRFPEEIIKTIDPELIDIWVNKQLKHEYNQLHNHTADMSFVIWIKIPYDLKEESKVYPDKQNDSTGDFVIHYKTITGKSWSQQLGVNKEWEGTMLMFPGDMLHFVNPFYTSDDYRISIAGNVMFRTNNRPMKEVYGE